jgi:lipopolysaccharide biosynthesis glycosyltransferase
MNSLIYFTVGFNKDYIDALSLAIKTLLYYTKDIDILVICDIGLEDICKSKLPEEIVLLPVPNSKDAANSSINKLRVFEFYPSIENYQNVLFIDSDVLIHADVKPYLKKIVKENTLYVYTESTDINLHSSSYFSYNNYTSNDILRYKNENIHVFNAGCFGFCPNGMKTHFKNITNIIDNHKGPLYIYEQSFMNVYFNTLNITDRTMLTDENYLMFPHRYPKQSHEGKLIHFCGGLGNGNGKHKDMKQYIEDYMPFIIIE